MPGSNDENWKLKLAGVPLIGPCLLGLLRGKIAARFLAGQTKMTLTWLARDRETSNYTYPLHPLNEKYLAAFLAEVTGSSCQEILGYIDELKNDHGLASHIASLTARHPRRAISNSAIQYCKRLGWYALVRALKPGLVIETGVDKGLGSCVLSSALLRNQSEGFAGRYIGTDINPHAGFLYKAPYSDVGKILFGDSITTLKSLPGPIDLFINDSDHSHEYEAREYVTISGKLSERAVIVGDNSHVSKSLVEFAERSGRSFLFWKEQPSGHWYPGAGMGVAFKSRTAR